MHEGESIFGKNLFVGVGRGLGMENCKTEKYTYQENSTALSFGITLAGFPVK